jgi:FkbM family methyltransferase
MEANGRPTLPARVFRALFEKRRPRGYMRLGTWMARACPSMQRIKVPYKGTWVSLDLRKIDHQTTFFDGAELYEAEEQTLLEQLVPTGGTAIDVGANLGLYTITLARLVGPEGLVISFEPEADSLLMNTAALPQVIVRPFAVSDTSGPVVFRRHRSTALSRVVSKAEATGRDSLISSVTLDSELSRLGLNRVDFLKIDTEGREANVLAGARRLLSGAVPPVVLFEWIPGFRDRWEQSALSVLRENGGQGWRLFRVGWNLPIAEVHGFEEPEEEANIIAFPPSRASALCRFLECSRRDSFSPEAKPLLQGVANL